MHTQTVNYSIKNIQATVSVNTANLAADVFNWMPGPFKRTKEHIKDKEFNLNKIFQKVACIKIECVVNLRFIFCKTRSK